MGRVLTKKSDWEMGNWISIWVTEEKMRLESFYQHNTVGDEDEGVLNVLVFKINSKLNEN